LYTIFSKNSLFGLFLFAWAANAVNNDGFSFDGTYELTVEGELRRLSVCTNDDGRIYWGLAKQMGEAERNYVYAVGRDSSGINRYGNSYEIECDSFWFKEGENGYHTIQYYLTFNGAHGHRATHGIADSYVFATDTSSYTLTKISDSVSGECFAPSTSMSFEDVSYPIVYEGQSVNGTSVCATDYSNCREIQRWDSLTGNGDADACWAYADLNCASASEMYFDGGCFAVDNSTVFEWDGHLKFSQWNDTNPDNANYCQQGTGMFVIEDGGVVLESWKCETDNFGAIYRYFPATANSGNLCPIYEHYYY
jgi:hypothetical protein